MYEASRQVPLAELVGINPQTPVQGRTVPFVGMEDVSEHGRLIRIRERSRSELAPGQTSFRDGDVLFAKITPCMENGKGAYVYGLDERSACGSTEFHVLRAKAGVWPRFVYHWTQSYQCRRAAEGMMTGSAGQRRVPAEFFHRFKIPCFDHSEQRRIAEILDTFDDQIDDAEAALSKRELLRRALIGRMIPVAPDPRWLEDGWETVPLADVVPSTDYGISAPLTSDSDGVPTLRMNNLDGGKILLHELKVTHAPVPIHLILRDRDVLFNRTNSLDHVGRTSIWRMELVRATFASYLVRLNPEVRRLIPEYLVLWLNLPAIQQRIRRIATHGVHQANINPTNLRKTLIEVPNTVAHQLEIVRAIDDYDQLIGRMKAQLTKLRLLKAGLMDDLLNGRVRVGVRDHVGGGEEQRRDAGSGI